MASLADDFRSSDAQVFVNMVTEMDTSSEHMNASSERFHTVKVAGDGSRLVQERRSRPGRPKTVSEREKSVRPEG